MKYCHVFKAAGICGIHPRHPLVSAPLALQAFKLSCLKQESINIKGRRGKPRSSWSFVFVLRASFVVFRFGVSVCLQHNMLDNGNPLLSYMMPKTSNQASISEDLKMQSNLRYNLLKKSYTKFSSNHPTTLRNACENALQFFLNCLMHFCEQFWSCCQVEDIFSKSSKHYG